MQEALVVGIHHGNQTIKTGIALKDNPFAGWLLEQTRSGQFDVIFEEYTLDQLTFDTQTLCNLTAFLVAQDAGLKHVLIEMEPDVRRSLSIPTETDFMHEHFVQGKSPEMRQEAYMEQRRREYFPVREAYWYQKIKAAGNFSKAIVIVGAAHLVSFPILLLAAGVKVSTINFSHISK